MPGLQGLGTFKESTGRDKAITIRVDEREFSLTHAQTSLASEAQIVSAIQAAASLSNVELPDIFVHRNRDGSLALAAYKEPRIWPEDWTDDDMGLTP